MTNLINVTEILQKTSLTVSYHCNRLSVPSSKYTQFSDIRSHYRIFKRN